MDIISYEMGKKAGSGQVVIEEGSEYSFTDPNEDGNIIIEEVNDGN